MSDEDRWAIFRVWAFSICLPLVLLTFSIFARRYAEANNHRLANPYARTYFRKEIPTPLNRERSVILQESALRGALFASEDGTDPFLEGITAHLKSESFDFSSLTNSSQYVAPPISTVTPLAARLSTNREYASLYDFARELLAHNAFDDEERVLKSYWETVAKENSLLTGGPLDDFVRYILDTYAVPALELLRTKRISRARDLLVKAATRLEFVPFEPEKNDGTLSWSLRERILVLAALLDDEVSAALHYETLFRAAEAIVNDYPMHLREEWFSAPNPEISPIIRGFIRSRYLLSERRYDNCMDEIEQMLRGRLSSRFRQYLLVTELRCAYLQDRAAKQPPIKSRIIRNNLLLQLAPTPFATEIGFYRNALGASSK